MLRSLHITNYAIVDDLILEFQSGMTVLSGETGAGKSILLDALALTLGDRADSGDVAPNAQRAEITATFDIDAAPLIMQWLEQQELDSDGDCIIRRTIHRDGRSRGYINGQPVPLKHIRELGEHLIELHGQHAHQKLLQPQTQLYLLDLFIHQTELTNLVAGAYRHWKKLSQQQQLLLTQQQERLDRLDLLHFQIEELQQLALDADELASIEQEHSRLSNVQELVAMCRDALFQLDEADEHTIVQLLARIESQFSEMASIDNSIEPIRELIDSASIQLHEAVTAIRHYSDGLDMDPQQQQALEQRLSDIQQLARKHRTTASELPLRLQQLVDERDQLQQLDTEFGAMDQKIAAALAEYSQLCSQLTAKRSNGAVELAQIVTTTMRQLGMTQSELTIALQPLETPSPHGNEQIEFLIQTNSGQPKRPMHKIASGGELSRISLAIQVNSADKSRIPTMIFDEIDVGVGGQTAAMVGQLLQQLGKRCQVICVTHQPQVAASGHHHYSIAKQERDGITVTTVEPLDQQQRIQEIARMSGGLELTADTLNHAENMLRSMQQS